MKHIAWISLVVLTLALLRMGACGGPKTPTAKNETQFGLPESPQPLPLLAPKEPAADSQETKEQLAAKLDETGDGEDRLSESDQKITNAIKLKYVTGDFAGALGLAETHLADEKLSPNLRAWLERQRPTLLTSAGWAKLRVGDCEEALALFEASAKQGKSPELSKGMAYCYYRQKNLLAAKEEFSHYLRISPSDSEMLVLYADLLETDGRFDEAVAALEQAAKVEPQPADDRAAIDERLSAMRRRKTESQHQIYETSNNFQLTYRAEDSQDLIETVLQTLELSLDDMVDQFGFRPPNRLIEVILYPGDVFSSLAGGPTWAEGIFDGRMRIPVRGQMTQASGFGHLPIVLRHELVHALFAEMIDQRSLPPWFNEGLAQRFSCDEPCRFQFGASPGDFLPIEDFDRPFTSFGATKAGRAYQQSLYLTFVMEQLHEREVYRRIISKLTVSSPLDSDAILEPLNTTFAKLHAEASERWAGHKTF